MEISAATKTMRNPIYSLLIGQMDNDLVNNDHQALSQSHGINSILYLLFILLEFCKKKSTMCLKALFYFMQVWRILLTL